MPLRKKICLITPGHLSSTPRLVREADSLAKAGHEVVVVAGSYHPPSVELDQSLLRGAEWEYVGVGISQVDRISLKFVAWGNRLFSRCNLEADFLGTFPFSALLLNTVLEFATDADLYIGHTMPGLYVAKEAARLSKAQAGFDIEDYHPEEAEDTAQNRSRKRAIYRAMKKWLPLCQHLTAASPLIAEQCRQEFGITAVTVLNTYPLEDAPEHPVVPRGEIQFYWFSQTIGPGRGLEEFIEVMGKMRTPCELSLRGMISEAFKESLADRATVAGVEPPRILGPCAPEEIVRSCAGYHFGLSLERSEPENRDLCLTNKLFAYLLAGTPVILSATRAHKQLAPELGRSALIIDFRQADEAAKILDDHCSKMTAEHQRHDDAWEKGRSWFCWEQQEGKLRESVETALSS